MVRKRGLVVFSLLFMLGLFLAYTYNAISKAKETIFERIEKHEIDHISLVLQNLQKDICANNPITDQEGLVSFFEQKQNREKYEHILSMALSSDVKYSYILYKDDENKFRFLLDASKTDKANFNQKFDINLKEYNLIYTLKEPQIIKQKNIENIYVTYLYPIISSSGVVVGFFNIDFTTDIKMIILDSIKPLEAFFNILTIFIFIFIGVALVQIFHYFITRKKIFTDTLTNTFNRNYLEEIEHVLNLEKYSVAILDLDKFKFINDTYGHKAGDYILSHVSAIFKDSIRDSDILVRYGGEEFLLLINNRDDSKSNLNICERIRSNIAQENFSFDGHDIKVTLSMGVHKHPSLEKNLQEAIKIADKMLYEAKRSGRNKIVIYDEKLSSYSSASSSAKYLSFVKEALDENRITCHYQPIYNHKTGEIFKYEALVRIIDKDGKTVMPMSFMPYIKLTNMHYKLTQRILSLVLDKFKENQLLVSININFSDLMNPDIEQSIVRALKSNHHLASRVTFEILESDEIDNIELFKQKIHLLHSLKAKVSIDDFGSGYSNFKSVIDVEANFLKIDGSLIKNIDVNSKDFKVVKSIIHFAAQSNMQTIAEFVHSREVYEKLLLLDIDYMQGYYISKPEAHLVLKNELFKTVF
jgi:diguanylate cyclase (GGDEF)-like protein